MGNRAHLRLSMECLREKGWRVGGGKGPVVMHKTIWLFFFLSFANPNRPHIWYLHFHESNIVLDAPKHVSPEELLRAASGKVMKGKHTKSVFSETRLFSKWCHVSLR